MAIRDGRGHIVRNALLILRLVYGMFRTAERISARLRGLALKLRIMSIGGRVGRRLSVASGVRLVAGNGAKLSIGDRVSLSNGVVLSVGENANLELGDDVYIGHYTIIGAEQDIVISGRVQIAEHCSIRDHDHDTSAASMQCAPPVLGSVSIGTDAWIGRGVAVLKGAVVGTGAVVGANAVVRGVIHSQAIAVGMPARAIRHRPLNPGDEPVAW